MKRPTPKKTIKVRINKEVWTINLYTYAIFDSIWPDTMGITMYDCKYYPREIYLRGPKVSKDTIAHELLHAYLFKKDFSQLSYGKIEEEICEVIGKIYKNLYKLTNLIYKELNE